MRFLSVRDLRNKSAQVWKDLPEEQEMVITNNGRPVAILSSINEKNLEAFLNSIRKSRLVESVSSIQQESIKKGKNKLTIDDINQEIKEARKALKQ